MNPSVPIPALDLGLIEEATHFLKGRIRRTSVEYSPGLSEQTGVPVWLKLESLQLTGSFKIRGACFRIHKLSPGEKQSGIATCSAGNHGKAVAYVARSLNVRSVIYVPQRVDESKYRAMVALGAEVVRSEFPGYDDTEVWAVSEAERSGKIFISAFDDPLVMAANGGSLAVETLADLPDAREFLLPVGGGGLSAGFAFYVKATHPGSEIVACQLRDSPALRRSMDTGLAVTRLPAIETAAAGLEGGLGKGNFEVLKSRTDRIVLLTEEEILDAVLWMLKEHQYLIEPSAAVTVAACLTGKAGTLQGPAVVVLSGRNVDISTVRSILSRNPSSAFSWMQ